MRRKHQRGYPGRFTRLASRYRSLFTLVWTFLALLSVPGFNGFAHAQSATYRVTFEGKFTASALASGVSVPSGEHFTTLIGAVHNGGATFWSRGALASAGVEPIASLTFALQAVAPEITSATTFPVDEATPAVATLTAEDQDSAAADLEWSKAGGADAGQFTLSTDGDLAFAAAPDYENPDDADGDNVYEVTVQVREGTNTATADIEVTVVNVDEAGSVSLFPALLQVRTVVRPTLSDPDGGISAVAWQWARSSDKMTWADIDRAVRADYLPTDSDQGQYLRATASYTDGEGADKTAVAASEAMVGKREPGPELSVKTLVSGLKHPWGIAFLPDETMLFGERDEKLMVRLTDGTVRDLTADLSDRNLDHNNGLMGIVVDPDFTTNRRFYTCMSHTGSVVQVIVWELDATYTTATRVVDPLVDGIPSGRGHNGCRLRFGPDGYLWISTGDTEVIGTTPQDLDSLGGKVLRVNAAGVPPADNPFSDSPVYSYGHRNPQGLALRPGTRQMWVVEHGPDWDDEINLLASGANYGWEPVPTNEMGEPQAGYDDTRPMTDLLKFPSAVEARWSSGYPTIATSGAIFLEGERWGIWEGRLAVATLKNRSLHLFEFSEDGNVLSHVIPPELDHTHDRLRTPMLGPDDALYISTSNGRHRDLILRLTPQQAPEFASDTAPFEVPENTDGTTPVATVEATDYNHDELTYTLGGTDVKSFYILDENIGELRVPSTTQLDFETKRTYEVTVTATDDQNTSDTVTLTIEVTDVEHEGTVTLSSTQPRVDSPFQASLSDPDGGVTATTWKWERSDDGVTGWEDIDGARSASYTPVADDAGKYLRATVTYTNTHGPGKTAQSVTSSAVGAAPNSNPEFPSASLVRRVAEHTAAGQPFDSPVEADDADGDPLQYALSGMDADLFDIDSSTGQLLTKAALDYEVVNEYEVVVSVSDGKDTNDVADDNEGDDSVTVPIKVINVDEPGSVSLFPSQLRVRTVVRATLTDPDGDLSAVSWRWAESSDKTNWTNIDGATEADYLPTEATQGKYLRAKATSYGDGEGSGKTAQTESNAVVGEREPAPEPTVVAFVSGLSVPWGMTFAPDGTMLFTERGGRLSSRLADGTVQPVSADFDDLLVSGEAGLMAIAADPAFASNRRFYTCQAHTGPEVQVIAWTFNDDTYTAATRVADPLVGNIPAASRHSGCRLRFGPQRYLWIATGDATVGTAPQDLNSLGGKVLRVDAATGAAAAGNPFGSRLYTYGHRNVQGLARRPGTNQMWSVEHGPRLDDEINLLSAGGNYGWDPVPGYDEGVPMTDLVKFPGAVEARWSSGNPTLATSGGIFLEGAQWGRWDGRLAVATLKGSSLRLFEFTDDGAFVSQVVVPELDGRYGRLRTPLLGPDGALYVTTSNGRGQDKILRVSGSRAPAFLTDTETRNVDENNDISTFVAKVLALDSDGDTLTYTLSGPDAESFSIPDAAVGAMWANVAFDYETKRSYEVTVTATDPQGLNDSTTLTITVTDTDEPPDAPGAPSVSSASVTSLSVTWSEPANAGPAITDYDYRYRTTLPEGNWTEVTDTTSTALSATIGSLAENTSYDVQVRATNDEGTGGWSASGSGATDVGPPLDDDPGGTDTGGTGTGGGTGGGSGGGAANRPPVVEREIDDRTLDVGEVLELDIRLNFYDRDQRALDYSVESADPSVATVEVDRNGVLTIRGVKRGVTAITVTAADRRDERASDTFLVTVKGPALVALVPRAADLVREGFVRVINHGDEAGELSIEAIDDTGARRGPITLSIEGGETVHFNSGDLEDGNAVKGLPEGIGSGEGDWRLVLDSDLDFEVLSYIRTGDGFLTAMHDTVPVRDGAYDVAIFNPGGNPNQVSHLRLINPGDAAAEVTATGVDDAGASPGSAIEFEIPAGQSLTLTASDLEAGVGVEGALGDGAGKWRLRVTSNEPIAAMSLLSSPTGHLTNLSTVPRTPDDEHGVHVVPLFPSASDPLGRQGFVRVVNRSTGAGAVRIEAHDDSDLAYEDVTLAMGAGATVHFNSDDLELGNAAKGLSGSTGAGVGDWRLVLSSDLNIDVLAYIRASDGFLTSMHEVAPSADGRHWVAILNPGSNPNQVSGLRLVNPGSEDAEVTITGVDDAGASPGSTVVLTVPAGGSRTILAAELESGGEGVSGALGDGVGKWRLRVESEEPIIVMSLLSSPTGHLTNLSTAPDQGGM